MFLDYVVKQFAKSRLFFISTASFYTSPAQQTSTKSDKKGAAVQYAKRKLKDYKFPEVKSEDCEQSYISGWGPGGQNVNKLQNAAQIRHKPTNIIIKVHESRLLQDNIKIAFERLKIAIDSQLNGANSYESQFQAFERKYEKQVKRSREKRRQLKQASKDDSTAN